MAEQNLHMYEFQAGSSGRTTVLVHGVLASYRYFEGLVQELNTEDKIIGIDLLGFGDSPKPDAQYTVDEQAAHLYSTVNSAKLPENKIRLICHSLGAVVGLRVASEHPEIVESLTLVGTAFHQTPEEGFSLLHTSSKTNWLIATKKFGKVLDQILYDSAVTPFLRKVSGVFTNFSPATLEDASKHTFTSLSRSLLSVIQSHPGEAAADLEKAIENGIPVTVMYGNKDPWVNMRARKALQDLQSQHKSTMHLHELPGDHNIIQTTPKAIAKTLAQS